MFSVNHNLWVSLDPSQKPKTPLLLCLVLEVILVLAYTVKSSPQRPYVFFIPFSCLTLWILFCTRPDHEGLHFVSQLGVGCHLLINFFLGSANILLTNPQEDAKLLSFGDAPNHSQEKKLAANGKLQPSIRPISSELFLRRLWWGIILWGNPRGINYAHEPTTCIAARPETTSRITFVTRQVVSFSLHYCLWDIGMEMLEIYDTHRRLSSPLGLKLLSVSYLVNTYCHLGFLYDAMSIVSVTLRITAPNDWPPLLNRLRKGYTVRRFWGKFWHQMFRRTFTLHAEFFSKLLRLPAHSKITSYFKLFTAFTMSGILHYAGDAMAMQTFSATGTLKFFLAQALGITVEDAVLGLAQRVTGYRQSTPAMRATGFVWVFLWFGLTVPMWIEDQLDGGYVEAFRTSPPRAVTRLWIK